MNNIRGRLVLAGLCWCCAVTARGAEDEGWRLANLNPFRKEKTDDERTRASVRDQDEPASGWSKLSWPKFGGDRDAETPKKSSNQPGAWKKFTSGTKSFFSKTKDALTPGEPTAKRKSPARSSFTRTNRTSAKKKSSESSGGLSSLFRPAEEPAGIETVNDFLRQPMPQ